MQTQSHSVATGVEQSKIISELWIVNCELRVVNCELRIVSCINCEFKLKKCRVRAQCKITDNNRNVQSQLVVVVATVVVVKWLNTLAHVMVAAHTHTHTCRVRDTLPICCGHDALNLTHTPRCTAPDSTPSSGSSCYEYSLYSPPHHTNITHTHTHMHTSLWA